MFSLENIDNLASTFKICSTLYHAAEYFFQEAPVEICYTPICELIYKGWDIYETDHPCKPIFKNGVYVNDDSAYIGNGIIYAAMNFDIKSIIPNIPVDLIPEFRYSLALVVMHYMRSNKACGIMWNPNTCNWNTVYDIVYGGEKYGKTLTL